MRLLTSHMQLQLTNLGKRYNRHWIFRRLNATVTADAPVAITGANGSGKSTLLQVIAGALEKSEGELTLRLQDQPVAAEDYFRQVALCAPYLELIEELTLTEFLAFHEKFRPWLPGLDATRAIELMQLGAARHQQMRYFSSGMKQRVKLAQAICSQSVLLLLDEPTSNLDLAGITMYHQWMQQFAKGRLVLIASNDEQEISFCQQRIAIADFK